MNLLLRQSESLMLYHQGERILQELDTFSGSIVDVL